MQNIIIIIFIARRRAREQLTSRTYVISAWADSVYVMSSADMLREKQLLKRLKNEQENWPDACFLFCKMKEFIP